MDEEKYVSLFTVHWIDHYYKAEIDIGNTLKYDESHTKSKKL